MSLEYFNMAEIYRIVAGMVSFGRVTEVVGDKAKVRIEGGVETPFLNTLKKRAGDDQENWPLEVGEQVLCLFPRAKFSQGIILGSVFTDKTRNNRAGHNISYSDGASFNYDKSTKKMSVTIPSDGILEINIKGGNVHLTAKNVTITAENISLGGEDAKGGVVTTESICAFTGNPHPIGSQVCKVKHA